MPQDVEMVSTLELWMTIYRSSRKGQPLHQRNSSELSNDAESPKAPSNYFSRTLNSTTTTLLNYPTSTNPTQPTLLTYSSTQLHPVSVPSQAIPHAVRSRDQCQDNGRRPHRSVGSTRRTSPPEGWRMEPRTQIHLEIEESW